MSERLLTPEQVAARYQLDLNWLYHCRRLKKYARKAGRFLRYRESDLEAFEMECAQTAQGSNLMRRSGEKLPVVDESVGEKVEGHQCFAINGLILQCRIRTSMSYILKHLAYTDNIRQAAREVNSRLSQVTA